MNAGPMHYALLFKKEGFDVKYIVEAQISDSLMRPEYHFPEIKYPYPDWIKEIPVHVRLLRIWPDLFFKQVIAEMSDRDVIFFNDYGHVLAKYFPNAIRIALFSGQDLDVHADLDAIEGLARRTKIPLFKYIKRFLITKWVRNQRYGIACSDITSYFPEGFNPRGDRLLKEIKKGQNYSDIRSYVANFSALGLKYAGPKRNERLVIVSAVRFLINPETNNQNEYKGNDIIIRGIAEFYKINRNIEVHFVEKGQPRDLVLAKKMCQELGISTVVRWHDEMPLQDLIDLYEKSDVCFDQVGTHFIGGIGMYALFMGKPLIANARLDVLGKVWNGRHPILNATTDAEVLSHLIDCLDYSFRERVGIESHDFALRNFDASQAVGKFKTEIFRIMERKSQIRSG